MLLIMSTAASTSIAHFSTPASLHLSTAKNKKAALLLNSIPTSKITSPPSISKVQYGYGYSKKSSILTGFKPFSSPVMEWQDCTVKMEIDVPVGVAYKLYSDRESIPRWMPFISSVQVLKDKPDLSRWSLKYKALGQELEYSWLARNMQPTPNQKIHWRSLEGLPNRGSVRFFPRGSSSCQVEVSSYIQHSV
ncbi:POLYKETIDE CYCLASE/DEHYDRASE AND LIPID TRANSPORT SUPERFAMILY PROTEIN [Salix purpurea]|uniref:POLYKETIDE CYCLASE/DEHYDRASE AND LIPID TRANSPORT SUPERFAMILY PROTEIN n=1 Tax=Salix purpurea TaxID=77065 RepID=A0A9Q0P1W2_SALPP|nr:POLYKETIDE CYCLASE/DEHYDRASE AND LIPID TRANSPORT SUPERFAMILY PROTEIN [Salix purpurea]